MSRITRHPDIIFTPGPQETECIVYYIGGDRKKSHVHTIIFTVLLRAQIDFVYIDLCRFIPLSMMILLYYRPTRHGRHLCEHCYKKMCP